MANTVNAALKPLETLSRIVNQPSSLFGGKGGSSKSKTEHDTVGAARDNNSNTQDQGINIRQMRYLNTRLVSPHVSVADVLRLFQETLVRQSQWMAATGSRVQTMT